MHTQQKECTEEDPLLARQSSQSEVVDRTQEEKAAAYEAERQLLYRFRFYKPPVVLALLTLINFFIYYGRGGINASLKYIKSDPHIVTTGESALTDVQSGAFTSIFMAGFLTFNPIFVALGGTLSSRRIILIGMILWCAAVVASGLAVNYAMLMIARGIVGVAEAAFFGFAVTTIDNMCPKQDRTRWIGTFYAMLSVGTAAGIAGNGVLCASLQDAKFAGWRVGFLWEVVPMALLLLLFSQLPAEYNVRRADRGQHSVPEPRSEAPGAVVEAPAQLGEHEVIGAAEGTAAEGCVVIRPIEDRKLSSSAPLEEDETEHVPFQTAFKTLATNVDFVFLTLGYAAYDFTMCAVAAFAVLMLTQSSLNLSNVDSSLFVGISTSALGLIGTILGGYIMDRIGGSHGLLGSFKCALLVTLSVSIAVPVGFTALSANTFAVFAPFFLLGVLFEFILTAPLTATLLTVVHPSIRPYSISVSNIFMHLLGDVPSPIVAGAISDIFDDGCSRFNGNSTLCAAAGATNNCRWVPASDKHEASFCANTLQLKEALRWVWVVQALCIPAWGIVAYRRWRLVQRERAGEYVPPPSVLRSAH